MSVPIVQTYTQSKGEVSYENSSSPSGTKRRYHNVENSQYLLPNDEEEVDRLHFQHWIVRHVQGGLNFCAPLQRELERGIDVLDVGTGPGTWILEMAKDYQASRFTGMDISDNWPHTIKPSNSHFVLANLNETLPFEDESFDYIHMRFLMMGLTEQQYIDGFTKIFKLLRPGGCFELGEVDVRFAFENSIWNTFLKVMMSSRGLNYAFIDGMHKSMENTGFINVESNYYRTPLGGWGGKLGRLSEEDTRHVYADFKEFLMKPLNMDSNQYDEAVEKEFKEFYRLHTKLTLIKFIGYKP